MKKLIYLLLAMPLLFASCSKDEEMAGEETVQVSFSAELPKFATTRADAGTLNVDKVVCAVFEGEKEISFLREEVEIQNGNKIVYAPRLIKGRTYDVVFWAMKGDAYNVADVKNITRKAGHDEMDYDAFTATTQITVESNSSKAITLSRPLAQLNLGVTPDDWNGVADAGTFGMTPTTITLKIEGMSAFNALEGTATGESETQTYNLTVSGEEFTCNGNPFKQIASCYLLAEANRITSDVEFSLYDQDGKVIRQEATISNVPLQRNYITNVVGGLLTGVISYEITFEESGEFAGNILTKFKKQLIKTTI